MIHIIFFHVYSFLKQWYILYVRVWGLKRSGDIKLHSRRFRIWKEKEEVLIDACDTFVKYRQGTILQWPGGKKKTPPSPKGVEKYGARILKVSKNSWFLSREHRHSRQWFQYLPKSWRPRSANIFRELLKMPIWLEREKMILIQFPNK